ncbi:enoyl-CoA hydratase/isomerase family protein [Sorangium sp. So ce1389]|uniref:enoyl-CoA hydratase/isomerase family protein n=1 Tax=Sorangium sp. So ce1389 TaxID=3133336 RepID=UPI003F632035
MQSSSSTVQYALEEDLAQIQLAQPERGNPLDGATIARLAQCLRDAASHASCRAIVISAAGPRFCSGADVAATSRGDEGEGALSDFVACLSLLCAAPVPVIACVEGDAYGGGVGLAAACDIVLASEGATFMLSEVILGMIPALISPFLLRRMTPGRLRYMMLSTRGISALEAREAGLVDEVVPAGGMTDALDRQLRRIGRSSPEAIAHGKAYLERIASQQFDAQIASALEQHRGWLSRPEVLAGLQTFADGFSPPWFRRLGRVAT